MSEEHVVIGEKLHVYRRQNSPYWQCSAYLAGRNHRTSTKEADLKHARKVAEDWYLTLQLKNRSGELKGGHLFKDAAAKFEAEYVVLTVGERSPKYVKGHSDRLRVHLIPFFGEDVCSDIGPQRAQDYRVHRMTSRKHPATGEPLRPARSTIHQEIVALRLVLKTARRLDWIKFVPDLSPPYRGSGKVSHRAWFSPDEYKALYTATRERAADPRPRWTWECEQLHDYVLFMVNTGLRPDESARLQFRDVEVVKDGATGDTILEISVRGKRGVGYCKSMPGAVLPFERLKSRKRVTEKKRKSSWGGEANTKGQELSFPKATDLLFPDTRHHHLNSVLEEEGLKFDREGQRRTAYSLRHTYISMRLMEGADIYQIAKNTRTSVEMIQNFYAAHIKNMIDAAAVNVRRTAPAAASKPKAEAKGAKPAKGAGDPERRAIRKRQN